MLGGRIRHTHSRRDGDAERDTTLSLAAPLLLHAQPHLAAPHLLAAAALTRSGPALATGAGSLVPRIKRMVTSADKAGQLLLGAGALGSAMLAGLYFIFSFCVMRALDAQPPASAIATMNAINRLIINPPFLAVFMGTPAVCAALLWLCGREGFGAHVDTKCTAAGALALLLGEFALTAIVHVPKNNALAAYALGSASDASTWQKYSASWTAWNHVRMAASVGAAALFSAALHFRAARLAKPAGTPLW